MFKSASASNHRSKSNLFFTAKDCSTPTYTKSNGTKACGIDLWSSGTATTEVVSNAEFATMDWFEFIPLLKKQKVHFADIWKI